MLQPKDLSHKDLQRMHNMARQKYKCAKDNTAKGEASIVLSMIDKELDNRGYDVTKLFKGYDPENKESLSIN